MPAKTTPARLALMRQAYEESDLKIEAIASDFGISHPTLCRLARVNKWTGRYASKNARSILAAMPGSSLNLIF